MNAVVRRQRLGRFHHRQSRFRLLATERLEDRSLLASVTYQLHLVAPNAAASAPDLSSVGVGDSFDLVLTARDSRTPADSSPGVYAAYVDVGYDSAKANIAENGFVYATNFFNGQSGTPTTNLIDDLGSFYSGVFSVPPGAGDLEIVRVKMVAAAAGTLSFTPDVSHMATPSHDTLLYHGGKVATADIDPGTAKTITIGAGAPITAVADSAAVLAGSTNNVIDVLANDTTSPATGQSKAIVSVTQPAHGTVTFSPNNVAFYTPASDFAGTDTFTYTAQNTTAGGGSPTSTASVTVTVGSPITAVNDTASMIVGGFSTTIDVLANDTTTPASGQTKSLVSVTQPGHGSATISNNQVVYQPATGYVGTDSFTYAARNTTAGAQSATSTATVSITINPVTAALMHYQVRVVPSDGALFMPDPQNPHGLVPTSDLTSLKVGDSYDLVVTVQASDPASLGVFAAYLDIGYDSSKTQVGVAETQSVSVTGSGSFSLTFNGQTTQSITTVADSLAMASSIRSALEALPSIGAGNVEVFRTSSAFTVRFIGKFLNQDVPKMTADPGGTVTVSISNSLDLQNGVTLDEMQRAFFPLGVSSISTVADDTTYFRNGFNVGIQPDLLDDVGAFTILNPGLPTAAETAAGFTVAPPRELVRAHFVATSAGIVTFAPDLTNIKHPDHDTLILGMSGGIGKDLIDIGSSRTLTISANSAPTLDAIGDKTILEDAGQQAVALTGISAGGASDAGQSLTITATSSNPELIPNPTVTYGGPNTTGGLSFTPAANKSGTATITVTVKDNGGTGGGGVDTFTRTFIVTVGAVNDAPSFTKGADQEANDESGSVSVTGWATNVLAGPADEANQTLSFVVTTDNTSLFTVLPAIDATGKLTFTTAPNVDGIAQVTVVLHDNGGTDNGGHDASAAQTFAIHVAKLHPLHNEVQPLDASGDNAITAKDPLVCINYINAYGAGKVPKDPPPGTEYLDVNGDGSITAIDPLTVINYINAYGTTNTHAVSASSGGEGEDSTAADLAIAEIAPATPARPATANDLPSIIALLASDSAEQAAKRRKL